MKKIILLIILFHFPILASEERGNKITSPLSLKQHHFLTVYKHIRSWEGNYVNHVNDKGGKTYGGITKKYNPEWIGWLYIDGKQLKRHDKVDEVELLVLDYYLTIWVREGFENINNLELAIYLFDCRINHSKGFVRKVLTQYYQSYGIYNKLDKNQYITPGINHFDSNELVDLLRQTRIKKYLSLVSNDASQIVFIKGWLKRAI